MQYVIITLQRVIFSDTSTSDFTSELRIRSWLHAFVAFLMLLLKVLMWKVLTRCKIVLRYRFRQNENVKILRCDFFCFAPSKIYLTKFCQALQQKVLYQIKLILWFSGLKTFKDDRYPQKANLSSRKFLKPCFATFEKSGPQSNDLHYPFHTFAIKVKCI